MKQLFEQDTRQPETEGGRSADDGTGGEDSPDDALVLIGAAATEFAKLAQRHKFEVLERLLAMTRLEADEQLRARSRRKPS
ncbi:hypothetical protein AS156_20630 [Bradyrhizobium macuxiense]|uniref:Uncharacterized protein n=2 Tax=Bradyrhizobium macuxiense TaxID=1755647 RepID=A0A109JDD8_9BRAD|nr:hypothetical protein AS156_20630 [Bradyrhizobium macuxiense]